MASKVLILDAASPLGQAIYHSFETSAYAVLAPSQSLLDWTNAGEIEAFIAKNDISIVINVAGWGDPPSSDDMQTLVATATALASAAANTNAVVIHLSSYRVFGECRRDAYREEDETGPVSPAGEAFLAAEQVIASRLEHYLVVRVGWLMDIIGNSIFRRLLEDLSREDSPLEILPEYCGSPVSPYELGRLIVGIVNQVFCGAENWGIFHLGSSDRCTTEEFVEFVAELLDKKGALHRRWALMPTKGVVVESDVDGDSDAPADVNTPFDRRSSVLIVRRCRDNFGYQVKSWRQGLPNLVNLWLDQRSKQWT